MNLSPNLFTPHLVDISQLHVSVCHKADIIKSHIVAWHSWRDAPVGWRVAFILTDGISIYGISTFGRPVARGEDQIATLEHTRMALAPYAPRNSASFFMAACRRWIKNNMPGIARLISYVPTGLYSGVTYRADNWLIVYENMPARASWTNRPGRRDSGNTFRTKFEYLLKR